MNDRQSLRALKGFLIMGVAFGLGLGVFFLDSLRMALQKHATFYASFPSAPRLRVGSPVWIGGHAVGEVSAITFRSPAQDSTPALVVQMSVPREHQSLVRRGSTVRLTSARLVGEPVVDITPGPPGEPIALQSDTLIGPLQTGRQEAMQSFQHFQRSLDSLMRATRELSPLVEARAAQFASLAQQIEEVQASFGSLRARMAGSSLQALLNDPELRQTFASLSLTAEQLGPAFQKAASRYADPVLRQAFGNLQQRATGLSTQLKTVREQFANSSLIRFSQDSALSKALATAQVELDSLMAETRKNPLRFWLGNKKEKGKQ